MQETGQRVVSQSGESIAPDTLVARRRLSIREQHMRARQDAGIDVYTALVAHHHHESVVASRRNYSAGRRAEVGVTQISDDPLDGCSPDFPGGGCLPWENQLPKEIRVPLVES